MASHAFDAISQSLSFFLESLLFASSYTPFEFEGWEKSLHQAMESPVPSEEGFISSSIANQMSPQLSRCWK